MSSVSSGGPSSPTPSFVLKNITIDDSDPLVTYSQGWNQNELSSALGGSFHSSDRAGDLVSCTLPDNAVAVYYFGLKQSSGAFYKACLDCSTTGSSRLDDIDGHTDEKTPQEPTVLYSLTNIDPSTRHTLRLLNFPDARFGNDSTITVDSFVVTVRDDETVSSMARSMIAMDPTSTSSDDSPPSVTAVPSTTSVSSSASSPSSSSSDGQSDLSSGQRTAQKLKSPLMLTGVIIAVLFVVFTALFALMYFMRRRKRRMTAPGRMYNYLNGHWATKFFADRDKERRDVDWNEKAEGGVGVGNGRANGVMIERRGSDSSTNGLPSHPRQNWPPVSSLVYSRPPDAAQTQVPPPKSAPARTASRSGAFPSPPLPRSPRDAAVFRTGSPNQQRLMRFPSSGSISPPVPVTSYDRVPMPLGRNPSAAAGPRTAPLPVDDHNPFLDASAGANGNPYVAEARARVRDRARGVTNGVAYTPEFAGGQANDYYGGTLNEYYHGPLPVPSTDGAWYERPGPRPGPSGYAGYGAPQQYPYVWQWQGQGSWGNQ